MTSRGIDWTALLKLDASHPAPLYLQLKERLRKAAGDLKSGDAIPSEPTLMKLARVSRDTVRKAIAELVQEGFLYSRRGSGTFASASRIQTGLNRPEGFTETMLRLGRTPRTKVIGIERVTPPRDIAEQLAIEPKGHIFVLERLRLVDGQPAMLEKAYLPARQFPGMEKLNLAGSLYELMRKRYNVVPERGGETIFAVNADRKLAQLLAVPVATALLASIRQSASRTGIPLEYTVRHVRTDLCSYHVNLSNGSALILPPERSLMELNTRLEIESALSHSR